MPDRPITPWVKRYCLFADEFSQDIRYTNWRPKGGGDWLLIYTMEGSGTLTTPEGAAEDTAPGDIVLYAPGESQDYKTAASTGKWRLNWVHFEPRAAWTPWLRWPLHPTGLRLLHLPEGEIRTSFLAAFARMMAISRRDLPDAMDLAQNALEEALLWSHIAASDDKRMSIDPRIRRAIDHLSGRFREPFDLETVARVSGLSVSRLAHLFKEETGMTVRQFLELQRLQHAEQLLRISSLSVTQIADATGYDDPFYFSNRFRRHTGRSPSEFRASSP